MRSLSILKSVCITSKVSIKVFFHYRLIWTWPFLWERTTSVSLGRIDTAFSLFHPRQEVFH